MIVEVWGRNRWCLKATALPLFLRLPLCVDERSPSALKLFELVLLLNGVTGGRVLVKTCRAFEGEGCLETGSEEILLVLDGDEDHERSVVIG